MSLSDINEMLQFQRRHAREDNLDVCLVCSDAELESVIDLRRRCSPTQLSDEGRVDREAQHLMVRDRRSGQVLAATRIMTDSQASILGGFSLAQSFHVDRWLDPGERSMELSQTCLKDVDLRGPVLSRLWQGLALFVDVHRIRQVVSPVALPAGMSQTKAITLFETLREQGRVELTQVAPQSPIKAQPGAGSPMIPSLLQLYLRLGSTVVSEPHWDEQSQQAVFALSLRPAQHRLPYLRHRARQTMGHPRTGYAPVSPGHTASPLS